MIADALSSGHVELADWLFLLAAIAFAVALVAHLARSARSSWFTTATFQLVGLLLLTVAWFVL